MRTSSLGLVAVVLLALGLRAWPLHVYYLHPDQHLIPDAAMAAFLDGHWRPASLVYPSGEMYLLRAAYSAVYAVGHVLGRWPERIDFVTQYVMEPFPFLLVPRLWSCLTGAATVLLTAWLAAGMFGRRHAVLAGLLLALSFGHVRESHWGSLDAPAACFATATLLAADRHRRTGRPADLVLAGLLAGIATAQRYQLGLVALALPVTVALRRPRAARDVWPLAGAAAAAALAFAVLSPYTLVELDRFRREAASQWVVTYRMASPYRLGLGTLFAAGYGVAPCALALVGVAYALRRHPRATLPPLVVGAALLTVVAKAARVFLRYLLPLAPLIAVFAALAAHVVSDLAPSRWRRLVLAALLVTTMAEPTGRMLALERLLARPDTRVAAGRWLTAHAGDAPVLVPAGGFYGNPELPVPHPFVFTAEQTQRIVARAGLSAVSPVIGYGENLATGWRPGAYLVTLDHPLAAFLGRTPPAVRDAVRDHAEIVASFPGFRPDATTGTLFEPIDASAFPLRGIAALDAPGPNITVYRLRARALHPPATPAPRTP